jgi:hypothetical protein
MRRRPLRQALIWVAWFAAFIVLLTLPFTLAHGFSWLSRGYERIVQGDGVLTTTAYNMWWIASRMVGNNNIDQRILGLSPGILGAAMAAACVLPVFLRYLRTGGSLVPMASLYSIALYAFFAGMSARMLVYGLLWSLLWAVDERRVRVPVLVLAALQILGLMHNALWTAESRFAFSISPQTAAAITAAASVSLIGIYAWLLATYLGGTDCRLLTDRYRESRVALPAACPSSA